MREIKFRAWVTSRASKDSWMNNDIEFMGGRINEIFNSGGNSVADIKYLQYTGLKDKNGVEIYEGDIVQIKDHAFHKKPGDYTGIKIDGFYPVAYTERMELVAGQWLLTHQLPYVIVAGNIYENPELLKESAE